MKHLVWAAAAVGAVLTSSAFADVSITAAARAEATIFGYESPSRSDRPKAGVYDNGNMYWSKDIRHKDDVAINAKSDNAGITIKLSVEGDATKTGGSAGGVSMTSYQMWANFFGIRLDAGDYDQRLAKNLNNDTKFTNNYSGHKKPGIWTKIDGADWGLDASNITTLEGKKTAMNFQVSKSGLLDNKLTVRGVLFTYGSGTDINGDNHGSSLKNNEKWIFTPFALGGEYKLDNNTQVYFNVKLNNIVHDASNIGQKIKADNSVWTLNGNIYKKLDSGMEVEAHYTLGASLYSNWSGHGGHAKKTVQTVTDVNGLVRDFDVFAHGVDFRVVKKLSDALTLRTFVGLNYVQSTEIQRRANRLLHNGGSGKNTYFKDSRAKSYYMGAAGTLAYWTSFDIEYVQNDAIAYGLQTVIKNDNLFQAADVKEVGGYKYYGIDYYKKMTWTLRPTIKVTAQKNAFIQAGVDFTFSGFQQNATGSDNTFKTKMTVPIVFYVSL